MKKLRRLVVSVALLVGVAGSALPARANPLVCATVYYRLFGGPKEYVLNNQCYVPTSWPTLMSKHECNLVWPVEVCYTVTVSSP